MESNPYEVRCPRCNTSFAPETRTCVHCGGPLGRGLFGLPVSQAPAGADDEELPMPVRGRSFLWIVTLVLALAFSFLRQCAERSPT